MKIQLPPSSPSPSPKHKEEDDEFVPDSKRQKLTSPPKRVCLVTYTMSANNDVAFTVFAADLDSSSNTKGVDGFISIAPTFRLEGNSLIKGFSVLGSTLYIFESTEEFDRPKKSVHTVDLSTVKPCSGKLDETELDRIPDMNHIKRTPCSIPTPDGQKLEVHSCLILFNPIAVDSVIGDNDFELYDPIARAWQTLPGISYDWKDHIHQNGYCDSIWINTGPTFIGRSTFAIQTTPVETARGVRGLIFTLDLESIEKGWQPMDTFYGADVVPRFVIQYQVCVNPDQVHDLMNYRESFERLDFPRPLQGDDDSKRHGPFFVTLVGDVEDEKYEFWNVEVGKKGRRTGFPFFVLNSFSFDLMNYYEYMTLSAGISIGESFKFRVDGEHCAVFDPIGLFSF